MYSNANRHKVYFHVILNISAILKMLLAWQILYVWSRAASPQKWGYSPSVYFCLLKLRVRNLLPCKRQFHVTFFPEGMWPSAWGGYGSVMPSLMGSVLPDSVSVISVNQTFCVSVCTHVKWQRFPILLERYKDDKNNFRLSAWKGTVSLSNRAWFLERVFLYAEKGVCVCVFACKYFRCTSSQESTDYFIDFLFSVYCIHYVTDTCLECVLEKGVCEDCIRILNKPKCAGRVEIQIQNTRLSLVFVN